jgi:hypothetical protein
VNDLQNLIRAAETSLSLAKSVIELLILREAVRRAEIAADKKQTKLRRQAAAGNAAATD